MVMWGRLISKKSLSTSLEGPERTWEFNWNLSSRKAKFSLSSARFSWDLSNSEYSFCHCSWTVIMHCGRPMLTFSWKQQQINYIKFIQEAISIIFPFRLRFNSLLLETSRLANEGFPSYSKASQKLSLF
jgi:hypothetical protein